MLLAILPIGILWKSLQEASGTDEKEIVNFVKSWKICHSICINVKVISRSWSKAGLNCWDIQSGNANWFGRYIWYTKTEQRYDDYHISSDVVRKKRQNNQKFKSLRINDIKNGEIIKIRPVAINLRTRQKRDRQTPLIHRISKKWTIITSSHIINIITTAIFTLNYELTEQITSTMQI